jgi:predicted extracellular nuclease
MSVCLATFNVENLMNRFDFSGYRNQLFQDRVLALYDIKNEAQYKSLEQARAVAHTDDARQLSALAIADTFADIICLQEVENLDALAAFEYNYLFKMVGNGYRNKHYARGNDGRGIDVAVMTRDETRDGEPIEFVAMTSHAHHTFEEFGLNTPELEEIGLEKHERIFRRDCLELDLRIGGKPLTLFVVHFKSMGGYRNGKPGREASYPLRNAEALAVRRIIENKFGAGRTADKRWMICGDMNDYRERIVVTGDRLNGFVFTPVRDGDASALDVFFADGFAVNLVERRDEMDRWTLFHSRGPDERHLCQLDYLLASPRLAEGNPASVPEIIREGQPYRTLFPSGQSVTHYPRTGWDRPKSSDHCPVAVTLNVI